MSGWIVAAVLVHLWLGLYVVYLSRRVALHWKEESPKDCFDADTVFWSRVLLYPVHSIDRMEGKLHPCPDETFRKSRTYVILHMLGWEIRIAINLVLIFVRYILLGLIAGLIHCVVLTAGLVVGLIRSVVHTANSYWEAPR